MSVGNLRVPKPRTFLVGEDVSIYLSSHQGETTPGRVVAVLNLDGWLFPHYVVEVEIGAPDPVLEVRDGFCTFRSSPSQGGGK